MPQNTWLTADSHFGHASVLRFDADRLPSTVTTVAQRDELIMTNWNALISPGDDVYHLGDFAYRNDSPIEYYTDRLNGRIHLILGNHDLEPKKRPYNFASVQDLLYLRHNREKIMMLHYPMVSWRGSNSGSWHCHGHVHGAPLPVHNADSAKRLDVGIMVHDYKPLRFDQVKEFMDARPGFTYHHGEVNHEEL